MIRVPVTFAQDGEPRRGLLLIDTSKGTVSGEGLPAARVDLARAHLAQPSERLTPRSDSPDDDDVAIVARPLRDPAAVAQALPGLVGPSGLRVDWSKVEGLNIVRV